MEPGKFVVIEGGEGAGKSTIVQALKSTFSDLQLVREPGGTKVGEEIRSILLSNNDIGALGNMLLFYASRVELIEKFLKPTREQGKNVAYDRYDASTYAYQVFGQENFSLKPLFWEIRQHLGEIAIPDLYIYLNVDVELGLKRAASRGGVNHFDARDELFHHRVRKGYEEFLERVPHVVIDANRSQDEVVARTSDIISSLFNCSIQTPLVS